MRRRPRRDVIFAVALMVVALAAAPAMAAGKPGYPDRVTWNGQVWQVKSSRSLVGPGPNRFAAANASVAADGLHLRITNTAGRWECAEVIGPQSYGYGTYTFTIGSRVDDLDANVVLGLFTWSDKAPYAHREIDVEFARWGNALDSTNAQFVVQPYDVAGHLVRFTQPAVDRSIHSFRWEPGRVTFESRRPDTGVLEASYVYTGADVPKPGDERVRLNLWLFGGRAPTDGLPVEVVVERFAFSALP